MRSLKAFFYLYWKEPIKANIMKRLAFISLSILFTFSLSAQNNFSNPAISIGVVVEDIQKSIDFYTQIIGMVKTGEFSVSKEKCTELGLTDSYQLDVTVLKPINSETSTEWKLMSLGTKSKHPKQKYMSDDTGIQYVTIFVKEIQPVLDRAKSNNVKILSGQPSVLDDGQKFLLLQDPDGNFLEIIGDK